jgi:hypothetical protein
MPPPNDDQVIIETVTTSQEVIEHQVNDAVEEVLEEIQDDVKTQNELAQLKDAVTAQGNFLNDINSKLDSLLTHTSHIESVAIETAIAVDELETEVIEEVETAIDQAETLAQIENDIEVDSELIEETLDTNDVIDAILPETKKERRRIRYI